MMNDVGSASVDLEVFDAIVGLDSVLVMHQFVRFQEAA